MLTIIGLVLALVMAWLFAKVGGNARARFQKSPGRPLAVVIGAVAAAAVWALLRLVPGVPAELVSGIAIGIGVGLFQGLYPLQGAGKR